VLGAVGGAQDNELRAAGDDAAAEGTGPGDYRRVAADPAGQLFPQHGGAHLGTDGGHGLLLGFAAQPGLEPRLELVEHPPHRRLKPMIANGGKQGIPGMFGGYRSD
jgi:hypothetical protein